MTILWSSIGRVAASSFRKTSVVRFSSITCSSWRSRRDVACDVRFSSTSSRLCEKILRSPFPDVEQPQGNLFNHIFEHAHSYGPSIALECCETGQKYTYNQLLEYISKFAGFLRSQDLSKGDMIAIYSPNSVQYEVAKLGAISQGIVVTTVNSQYTVDELARQLKSSRAKLLVSTPLLESTVLKCVQQHQISLQVVITGPSKVPGFFNIEEILKNPEIPYADAVQVNNRDVAVLFYSSGTTGPPKGVAVSHGALSINLNMLTCPEIFTGSFASGNFQNTYMGVLPFFHVYGLLAICNASLRTGGKLVVVPSFEPKSFLAALRKYKPDLLHLVPPLLNFLAKYPEAKAEDLSALKSVMVAAAPVSLSSVNTFKERYGQHVNVQEVFGMTEFLMATGVPKDSGRIGMSGQLFSNVQGKIIDHETGVDLLPNQTGEICIKSPSVMNGYFENEEATSATLDSQGWIHSGDIGYFDDEGYLKIVDRSKEIIKVKGFQVSPSELEDIIRKHPQVLDVGVVGIPHERQGEVPKAYIVSKGNIGADDIHRYLEDKVAPHKRLMGGVSFIEELPKSAAGKLLRRTLKNL